MYCKNENCDGFLKEKLTCIGSSIINFRCPRCGRSFFAFDHDGLTERDGAIWIPLRNKKLRKKLEDMMHSEFSEEEIATACMN